VKKGMLLNIQRFSVHDGPGIRTLVFMKGCPLVCSWCANPESQSREPELGFFQSKCVQCGKCIEACPPGAITLSAGGEIYTDRKICDNCGKCVEACSYEAREIAGEWVTVEYLLAEVEKDRDFYSNSGGGVTVGGGEPAYQPDFIREFLKQCQERWLHTAIETCGHTPWKNLVGILEYVDYILIDIKHMDPEVHKLITGVSNKLILSNIKKIVSSQAKPIIIRVPIIPGLNDAETNIRSTAEFISGLGKAEGIELLPYHRLGISKYEQFDKPYPLRELIAPEVDYMKKLDDIIASYGLTPEK
jgi:pyruvate formate lyase activating enzyme